MEILVKRSKSFYNYALEALSRGDFDLALFLLKQAAQLRVKALLLRLLGFTPGGVGSGSCWEPWLST